MNSVLLLGIILQVETHLDNVCEDTCTGTFITAATVTAKPCKMPKYPSVWGWVNQPGPIQAVEYHVANKKVGVDPNMLLLRDIRHMLFEKKGYRGVYIV